MKYDFSQDPEYIEMANVIIGSEANFEDDGRTYSIAIFDADTEFMAVVLYDGISRTNCAMHIASVSPGWATRDSLKTVFTYPFVELGMLRVTGRTKASNTPALTMARKLGFTREGELRNFYSDGDSQIINGLLRDECRWI